MHDMYLGRTSSVEDTVEAAFDEDTMKAVHGDEVLVEPWKVETASTRHRTLHICSPFPSGFPDPLRPFAGGDSLAMTVQQDLTIEETPFVENVSVKNNVKMHIVGAELSRIEPQFRFTRNKRSGAVHGEAHVRVNAILPPPLDRIAEEFMVLKSENEIELYMDSIRQAITKRGRNPIIDAIRSHITDIKESLLARATHSNVSPR